MAAVQLGTTTSGNARLIAQTVQGLQQLSNGIANLEQVFSKLSQLVDNPTNPTVFTGIETSLGLSAGQGTIVWSLLAAADPLISNVALVNLLSQLQ